MLSTAQKWFTGILTTTAAVVTLALNARNLGLSPWLGLLAPNVADHATRRIVLTPRMDTLRALGDSMVITATVTDARGGTLVGATLRWQSTDTAVATVDSGGLVIARAPGRAVIETRVRDVVARAAILVRQVPVRLAVAGDPVLRLADGDSATVAAVPVDALDHRIVGPTVDWQSSDTLVARVDHTGRVLATGAGTAMLEARLGDLRAVIEATVVRTPAMLSMAPGEARRALAGRPLAEPVSVRVLSRAGHPVAGVPVIARTEHDEGRVSPDTALTDAQGRARMTWALGPRAGIQRLRLHAPGIDTSIVVDAHADPVPANTRIESGPGDLRARAGAVLQRPVHVRVTDTLGIALEAVRVAWRALDGGAVEGVSVTDSAGHAEARWTLGTRAGPQRLQVNVGDPRLIPARTLRAVADPGAPHVIVLRSGGAQTADAGKALARPIVAEVRDSLGNPIADASVRARAGAGTVSDTVGRTDANGRISLRWTLGARAGGQTLTLWVDGMKTTLAIPATARAPRS